MKFFTFALLGCLAAPVAHAKELSVDELRSIQSKMKATDGSQVATIGDVPYVVNVLPGSDAEKKELASGDPRASSRSP